MLISNADDFGINETATSNILKCYEKHIVMAASAMVFMKASEEAARASRGSGLDVGLHLNLTSPFTGGKIPEDLAEHQARLNSFLRRNKYNLVLYNPYLTKSFHETVGHQYHEFLRLYGSPPSHIDGHHHMHLSTNILLSRLLPKAPVIRRNFSFTIQEKGIFSKLYRMLTDGILSTQHRVVGSFFSIEPFENIPRLSRIIELAQTSDVELMSHPERPGELSFMTGPEFSALLKRVRMGCFQDLGSDS